MKTIKDENYSFEHVKQRLKERYNIEIARDFYDRMNKSLRPFIGEPDCGTDNNGDQEIHTMFIKNKNIRVVYSKSKNRITTVLL